MLQKDFFMATEGDEYFVRNSSQSYSKNELYYDVYKKYLFDGIKVLEIGSGDGKNLNEFSHIVSGHYHGIDPSQKSIESGCQQYPHLNLLRGTADQLPYEDDFFDVVIFGFCFYVIDRSLLFKVVSECDRILKDGGLVGITDFDVPMPYKKHYREHEQFYTYKYDYSKLFTANPSYILKEKITTASEYAMNRVDIDERISTAIIEKNVSQAYLLYK